jgi:serpin B
MVIKAVLSLAALAILIVLLAGCIGPEPSGQAGQTPPATNTPRPSPYSAENVVDANNGFALDLYAQLAQDTDGNLFFSPYSISSALAVTYEGARGQTADEIRSVFHFPENRTFMREGFAGTIAAIDSGSSKYTLRTSNALWAEKTFPFLPEYVSIAEETYGAKTTNLDFINRPDESRMIINRWVEDQTEDKIRDLLPDGSISPTTRLVITNAIYFKGTWVKQFDANKTTDEDFRTGSGTTVRVPMMQRTDVDAIYRYNETDTLQVLAMPYGSGNGAQQSKPYEPGKGTQLSMLVLLPRNGDLDAVGRSLDLASLDELSQHLRYRRVMVYFPKFTMQTKYSLPDALGAVGMPMAFTGAADFSGMDGRQDLYIDDVIHQAYVDVNEEGTEATAATGGGMSLSSYRTEKEPVPVFRADHPFIFLIKDDETGNILFMGRVENPENS